MKLLKLLLLLTFVFKGEAQITAPMHTGALASPSTSNLWTGLLAPARAVNWSTAGAGPIPSRSVCTTLGTAGQSSSFAQSVTTANIVSALNSCASGQMVLLNPGTYTMTQTLIISKSNVGLRGSGPTQTILKWTATSSNCNGFGPTAFCVTNGDSGTVNGSSNICSVTGGTSRGSTAITISSCSTGALSNLKIGSLLQLEANDEASDNGQWWACGSTGSNGTCSQQGSQNSWSGNTTTQMVVVTGISGTTITISPGIYAPDWASGRTIHATYSSTLPVSAFGIENLDIDTESLGSIEAMIEYQWGYNDWVKNVSLINSIQNSAATKKHILIGSSAHITVRDSYVYGSSPTMEGYGIDVTIGSGDNLVENNICQHVATCTILENGMGNVFGYNYSVDNAYSGNPAGSAPNWQGSDAAHHAAGDVYNLWEGHEGIQYSADDIHGTSFSNTVFRSYLNGRDPANTCPPANPSCGTGVKNQNTGAVHEAANNRYDNIVANVLGSGTYFTTYQNQGLSGSPNTCTSYNWTAIYTLNFSDNQVPFSPTCAGSSFTIDNDPLVSTALMRWGNYDTVNAAVRTNAGETGSGASTYPGLVTPSTSWSSYPSFYYSSRPSWWNISIAPWPPIGPDVTGGNISNSGGHANHNMAGNCYLVVLGGSVTGSSGALPFDASTCYP